MLSLDKSFSASLHNFTMSYDESIIISFSMPPKTSEIYMLDDIIMFQNNKPLSRNTNMIKVSPRPRIERLIASNEPPKHNALGNVFLTSCKKKTDFSIPVRKIILQIQIRKSCNLQAIKKVIRHCIDQRVFPVYQPCSPITLS